jgi:collagenase-like PrtC family protease
MISRWRPTIPRLFTICVVSRTEWGQYFNTYNEEALSHLAGNGATHVCLPAELPSSSLSALSKTASDTGVGLEVQVYGRVGLALSARCYHARAHGRVKDNCQFVCEEDPDGMLLKTLEGQDFFMRERRSNPLLHLPEFDA